MIQRQRESRMVRCAIYTRKSVMGETEPGDFTSLEAQRIACENYVKGNNQKRRLLSHEVDKIVNTFLNKEAIDDFSVAVTYDEIKEKNYSLSAGQYFDIKIEYVDITEEEFNKRIANYQDTLTKQFVESHKLETEILSQLKQLQFNG